MTTDNWLQESKATLETCASEPIHVPGRVQPHGVLLVLSEPELRIVQASANCAALLGRGHEALLGEPVEALFGPIHRANLGDRPSAQALLERNPLKLQLTVAGRLVDFDGIVHRSNGYLLLELEPSRSDAQVSFLSLYHQIQSALASLEAAQSLQQLCDATAVEIRRLTGFDRVMIYQFDSDWNGRVVSECKAARLEPYLGLQYPAGDIPQQARDLYLRNWLRLIPDAGYTPSDLVPSRPPGSSGALDLTFSVLRSVSPIHLEYLKNMGVGASMSVSIIRDGKLWGLIACHHSGTRFLAFELRLGCELVGKFMSLQLGAKEKAEDVDYKKRIKDLQPYFLARMQERQAGDFLEGLVDVERSLLALTGASGAAIVYHGDWKLLGSTPEKLAVVELTRWLSANIREDVFSTSSLAKDYPNAEELKESCSGLLALRIPEPGHHYVLWFRPEVIQTVSWAGQPDKVVESAGAANRLTPRKSFELWKEVVRLRSLPWTAVEEAAAAELRRSLVDVDLGRQVIRERAARDEAERSNQELDQFAFVVSHDLKEPLRGIEHYSKFLSEDEGPRLSLESRANLGEIKNLTARMQALLTSLHLHSKIGRVEFSFARTDLNAVLQDSFEMLRSQIRTSEAEISIPRRFPDADCDFVRIGEVFVNLLSNALKYNTSGKPAIEIGYSDGDPRVYYVADNGIGIAPQHQESIFGMFKRLHGQDEFGGGTGSGLAIAKRIIERHQGRIWVRSQERQGSTFYFTLSPEGAPSDAELA